MAEPCPSATSSGIVRIVHVFHYNLDQLRSSEPGQNGQGSQRLEKDIQPGLVLREPRPRAYVEPGGAAPRPRARSFGTVPTGWDCVAKL